MRGLQSVGTRLGITAPRALKREQLRSLDRVAAGVLVLLVALGTLLILATEVKRAAVLFLAGSLTVTLVASWVDSRRLRRASLLLPFLVLIAPSPAALFDVRVFPFLALVIAVLPIALLPVYGSGTTRVAYTAGNVALIAVGVVSVAPDAVPLWLTAVLLQTVAVTAAGVVLDRLQDAEQRVRELDGAGTVEWETTAEDGAPLRLNRAAMQYFGFSTSVVDRRQVYGLVHNHDLKRVLAHWHERVTAAAPSASGAAAPTPPVVGAATSRKPAPRGAAEHRSPAGATHLIEARLQLPTGRERVVMHRISVVPGATAAETAVRVLQLDVTDQRQAAQELLHQATHDPLTGLANRALFVDRVAQLLARARRERRKLAVLMLDINGFKDINDSLGHAAGDRLLVAIGQRITLALRDSDAVARIGGDQFGVVGEITDSEGGVRLAERLREMLASPFELDELALSVRASIGIALFPEQAVESGELVRLAEAAMYRAKRYRLAYQTYSADLIPSNTERLALLGDLQGALARDELRLCYQPAVDLGDGRVRWVEALVRWRHPKLGTMRPEHFLELVEMSVMAGPVAKWVIQNAVADAARWSREGLDVAVHVNFPAQSLTKEPYVEWINSTLAKHAWPAERLGFEIGERELLADRTAVTSTLARLRELGVRTVLDDFGHGFSSLGYLSDLAVDMVKMDGSYVARLSSSRDLTVVRAMIDLAHQLGFGVVAEGVENQPAVNLLRSLGCDAAQGFFFAKTAPAEDLVALVAQLHAAVPTATAPGASSPTS